MSYTLQQLSDLEEIRQLKARYFRCIDTGNEAELATVFAEDVEIDLRGGGYRLQVHGRKDMVDFIASSFNSDVIAMHHGHTPEIRFTGPDTAEGVWYLQDRFIDPARNEDTQGSSLYRDRYVRTADGWKVAYSEYDRVFEAVTQINPRQEIRAHLLAKTGRQPEARADLSQWLEWFDEEDRPS
jgi:SnoaL-like domain